MAAPSGIVWGNEVTGDKSTLKGKIGIYAGVTTNATTVTVKIEVWFWSMYGIIDPTTSYYYNANATSATTLIGSININHTVSTGAGWSTSNQTKLGESTYTYTRGTSASTKNYAAKFTNVYTLGTKVMTATASVTVPALESYAVKYNANGGTSVPNNQTKWYGKKLTLSSAKPTRMGYSFQGWATSASGSVTYAAGASYTKNAAVTLYAVWKANTYTVSYNANGGNGAPSSQTKTYSKPLTLSNTKPTRTGYAFVSWNTKSDGTGTSHAPGSSYTEDAAVTLYAIWKINTYTVTYNANGGTLGNVKTQTKTYGTTLKLTGTATKTDYVFKGWATSKSGGVAYATGANYTANAEVTLYAVWELSYIKPKISSFSVTRCVKNSDNTYSAADEGTYCRVKFSWETSVANPTALIEWKETSVQSETVALSGASGTVDQIIGGSFSAEKSYSIKVTVDDKKEPQSTTKTLPGAVFPIDVKAGGTGVAIGKPAEVNDHFDVGFQSRFRKNVSVGEKTGYHDGKTGVYLNAEGYIHIQRSSAQTYHPYLGFYIDDATAANGQIRVDSATKLMEFLSAAGYKFGNNIYLPNKVSICGIDTNGNNVTVFQAQNENGNTVLGYGNYTTGSGNTNIYGNDVIVASAAAGNALYRPYYRKGDTIDVTWNGAGFVTSSSKVIYFTLPLSKPVIGSPNITAASVNGFKLRQYTPDTSKRYTHGSTADKWITPASYGNIATAGGGNHLLMSATLNDTTNAENNSPIGIQWSGTITFS